MPAVRKGRMEAEQLRFGIVISRYNSLVTERLLQGALNGLRRCGASDEHIEIVQVPGAFEIPLFAESLARTGKLDAVICLGAIVRGETQHHHYLADAVFAALQHLQITLHVPVAVGILTTDNVEQALARSGDDAGNKGYEAAMTAVETATLLRELG